MPQRPTVAAELGSGWTGAPSRLPERRWRTANGKTIDSFDIHEGYLAVKGHAGVAVVPAVLAFVPGDGGPAVSGQELLTAAAVAYEIALRADVAQHATACDDHTPGAWSALGCAAAFSQMTGLGADPTRHALGIAEFHGPWSQMMRCIDHPTMIQDGSGRGAMAGVSAAMLAAAGFTGAPAVTVEAPETAAIRSDLGTRWRITAHFSKPYAVCRWAQPAIEGALALQREHALDLNAIKRIDVSTVHNATRLTTRRPATTDQAQHSTPFPIAAALGLPGNSASRNSTAQAFGAHASCCSPTTSSRSTTRR